MMHYQKVQYCRHRAGVHLHWEGIALVISRADHIHHMPAHQVAGMFHIGVIAGIFPHTIIMLETSPTLHTNYTSPHALWLPHKRRQLCIVIMG